MVALSAQNLTKSFGPTTALSDFSISIPKGSIYALLGPNGAGKTTFIKLLLDLLPHDSGNITISGTDHKKSQSRSNIYYFPEKFNFFPYYSVYASLKFFANMYGQDHSLIEQALEKLKIPELKNRKIKTLSKGQLQRVGLSMALVSGAKILLLDEPFSGLDPLAIKEVKDLIKSLQSEGKTIILSSHILSEVEQLASDVAILNKGICLAQGDINTVVGDKGLENFFYDLIQRDNNNEVQ